MIYLKQWHQSGITFISDLLDNDFSFFIAYHISTKFPAENPVHNLLWSNKRNSTKLEMRNKSSKRPF